MLLTISTTHNPATDLGYLLYKHPDRLPLFWQPSRPTWEAIDASPSLVVELAGGDRLWARLWSATVGAAVVVRS